MLHVEMPLSSGEESQENVPHLAPVAVTDIYFNGASKKVDITLKGVIQGESASELLKFLHDVSSFPANKWILKMKDLHVLSDRGIHILLTFTKVIKKRGFTVEVHNIHKNIYRTFQDLNILNNFGWLD